MQVATSKNQVPIRLTEERWFHITEEHSEMAGRYFDVLETIEEPQAVYEGKAGELLAIRQIERGVHVVVAYRETSVADGFVITAFVTTRTTFLERRKRLWPR